MKDFERNILAVYDISNPRRLSKVAKTMEGYGIRVQQSVFELRTTLRKLKELHRKINSIIDIEVDSVRYYIICEEDWQKREVIGITTFVEPEWDENFVVV